MARVLLTGARGFIGRHCHRLLSNDGWEVHAVASHDPGEDAADGDASTVWHVADLLDRDQMRRVVERAQPSHLLHLAWFTAAGELYHSRENERWVTAGRELLEAAGEVGTRRAVVSGSCAEYDWTAGRCSETDTPLEPATAYGAAKDALRRSFESWGAGEDRSASWARLFFLYGPGEHPDRLVPYVIRSLLSGQPAECTHGRQRRDYLYVGDAADALVRLLGSSIRGPINIGSGSAIPLATLIGEAAQQLERPDLVRLGARPTPEHEPPLIEAEIGRQTRELGFSPSTELDAGIARTIAWWRREMGASSDNEEV